jgi:hypothetical protein
MRKNVFGKKSQGLHAAAHLPHNEKWGESRPQTLEQSLLLAVLTCSTEQRRPMREE